MSMKKLIAVAFLLAICLFFTKSASAASFDCSKAKTTVEHMICANSELSALDDRVVKGYKEALKTADSKESVKSDQRKWLRSRNYCKDIDCLKVVYEVRISELDRYASFIRAEQETSGNIDSIKKVNFANFTFHLQSVDDCAGITRKTITLRRGEFKDTNNKIEFPVQVSLGKTAYGDLTGDGVDEAVVELYCDPHGNYVDSVLFIYTLSNGEPTLLESFGNARLERDYKRYYPDKDSTLFGPPNVKVNPANNLVMSMLADYPHACPKSIVSFEYHWKGQNFVLVGRPVKTPNKECSND